MTSTDDFDRGHVILHNMTRPFVRFDPAAAKRLAESSDSKVRDGAQLLMLNASRMQDRVTRNPAFVYEPHIRPRYETDHQTGRTLLPWGLRWLSRAFGGPDSADAHALFANGRTVQVYDCAQPIWSVLERLTGHVGDFGPDLWASCADVASYVTGTDVARDVAKQQVMRLIAGSTEPAPAPWARFVLSQVARPWVTYLEMTATTPWLIQMMSNRMTIEKLAQVACTWPNTATPVLWLGGEEMVVLQD
jgi:hypothetical protein